MSAAATPATRNPQTLVDLAVEAAAEALLLLDEMTTAAAGDPADNAPAHDAVLHVLRSILSADGLAAETALEGRLHEPGA